MRLKDKYPHLLSMIDAISDALRNGPTDAELNRTASLAQEQARALQAELEKRLAEPKPAKSKRRHREKIAAKATVEEGFAVNGRRVVVAYRGHRCIYDVTGSRPKFVMRNDLAKPEEPAKIVQDGMRLAAVWHVHGRPGTLLHAAKNASAGIHEKAMGALSQRNSLYHYLVDPEKLRTDRTTIWFVPMGLHPKPPQTVDAVTFADVDEGNGRLLTPDIFTFTPELLQMITRNTLGPIGAKPTFSELLAIYQTLAHAARWKA